MFSIIDLIGRNPVAVEKILGEADDSEIIKSKDSIDYIKTYYRKGGIEIIYIDNIADWVIIHTKENKVIEEFINFLGFQILQASLKNYGILKYYTICGLKEVTMFGDSIGHTQMISIKAFTD